jgi:hypothetical protein
MVRAPFLKMSNASPMPEGVYTRLKKRIQKDINPETDKLVEIVE